METPTLNIEREQLLKIAKKYQDQGYEVSLHPNSEDLPDFLRPYLPDMIVRRGDEAVVIEVKSRSSLDSSSTQYLQGLAKAIEKNPSWRFELVMTNPEEVDYSPKAEASFQEQEIKSRLQIARRLVAEHPDSAILYSWSLVEATLRLVAEKEAISLQRFQPLYLVKKLATEGVIAKSEYQLLMNAISFRNAIVHGFKTTQVTQKSVYELIDLAEQLLKAIHSGVEIQ
jgi:hypothetical protein